MQRRFALIGHVHTLSDITDIALTGVADNDLLQYNSATAKWENITQAALNAALDHGLLAGLADDDHPQYPLAAGTETISGVWSFSAMPFFNAGLEATQYVGISATGQSPGDLSLWMYNEDFAANQKYWSFYINTTGTYMAWLALGDSPTYTARNVIKATRSGSAITALDFGNSTDNPDTTLYTDNLAATLGSYQWLTGTSDGATALVGSILTLESDIYSEFRIRAYVNDNYGPTMTFYHSRGTQAVPSQALSADQLGGFFWGARHESGGWHYPAAVDFTLSGNAVAATGAPGTLDFKTGATYATLASRISITTAGVVSFPYTGATYDVVFAGYPQFQTGFQCKDYIEFTTDAGGTDYLSWHWINNDGALDEKIWVMETDASLKTWALRHATDASGSYKNQLEFTRSGNATTQIAYGNSTDEPLHKFYGSLMGYDGTIVSLDTVLNASASGNHLYIQGNEWSELGINVAGAIAYGGGFRFTQSRGTLTAPTASQASDNLGEVYWGAYGTAAWIYPASMGCVITSTAAATAPAYIYFKVGSTSSPAERLRLYGTGEVYWGTDVYHTFDQMLVPSTPAAGRLALYVDTSAVPTVRTITPAGRNVSLYGVNNYSVAAQSPAAATRTYITGSAIAVPINKLQVGTSFRWRFNVTKTAAGTAASTYDVCFGTAGTTADTARLSFTKPAGTAAADEGIVEINCVIRTIGATGVAVGEFEMTHNLAATGHMTIPIACVNKVSAAFDMTVANLIAGVCVTSGASDALTIQMVQAEAWNI